MRRITVLDTTLRDGAQTEGVSFSAEDKRRIALELDRLGVDIVEGGNPAGNPKDRALFDDPPRLKRASFAAFGATRRADSDAASDAGLSALLAAKTDTIVLFGKSSRFHVDEVLRVEPGRNLAMIEESIARLAAAGRTVHFDAEHFFDGFGEDADYAIETARAAARGGARTVTLCDTNGGALPWAAGMITGRMVRELGLPVGAHFHDDGGMAVASTLYAVESGASFVHGTMGGVGERCGNADLCAVLPALSLKMGLETGCAPRLARLTSAARTIADIANLEIPRRAPYVGLSAFTHKGGMHVDGMRKNRRSFEHIDPALVGNERRLLISDQAGRSALLDKLADLAPDMTRDDPILAAIADQLKQRERFGYVYEGAEGSFRLMALRMLGRALPHFEALDFRVFASKPWADDSAQAYIKIRANDQIEITAAEGDGPVNALDRALRKALCVFYPQLSGVRLVDFKVRVIDGGGTGSTVRVTIESTDGKSVWGTVGVSRNIIEACWTALTDAIEYKLSGLAEGSFSEVTT
ncbi:MAG: citramalate synthase [Oscillospiraceae bacterium]|jgi:2-isopropylmalate synthase|nr:citramalate synthase [Oscillospiraceae bacterium]